MTRPDTRPMHEVIAHNLRRHLDSKAMTAASVAEQSGVLPSFIHDILSGKSTNPSTVKLALVARTLCISLSQLTEEYQAGSPTLQVISSHDFDRQACIPPLNPQEAQLPQEWQFSERWARARWGSDSAHMAWSTIRDDCMAPTLNPEDVYLLNTACTEVTRPGMYVIKDAGCSGVRRIQPHGGRYLVSCDNPSYGSYECRPHEIDILGRLVWTSHICH